MFTTIDDFYWKDAHPLWFLCTSPTFGTQPIACHTDPNLIVYVDPDSRPYGLLPERTSSGFAFCPGFFEPGRRIVICIGTRRRRRSGVRRTMWRSLWLLGSTLLLCLRRHISSAVSTMHAVCTRMRLSLTVIQQSRISHFVLRITACLECEYRSSFETFVTY